MNVKLGEINGRWASLFKICLSIGPFVVTTGFAAQGWILNRLSQIDVKMAQLSERQSVMEENRFTSMDGLKFWDALSKTREEMAKISLSDVPQWMKDRMDRMERNLDKLTEETLNLSKLIGEIHKP